MITLRTKNVALEPIPLFNRGKAIATTMASAKLKENEIPVANPFTLWWNNSPAMTNVTDPTPVVLHKTNKHKTMTGNSFQDRMMSESISLSPKYTPSTTKQMKHIK